MALALTSQDWTALGLDDDPNVAPSDDLELTVDRIMSLLLVRIGGSLQMAPGKGSMGLKLTT